MKKLILIVFCLLVFQINCTSQKKVGVSIGFGFAELLNIGVDYSLSENLQLATKVGILLIGENENVYSISDNIYYYYTGISKYTNRRTWYLLLGGNYTIEKSRYDNKLESMVFFNFRHGRVFNFSQKMGLKIDFGLGYILDKSFIPTVGVDLFYRI